MPQCQFNIETLGPHVLRVKPCLRRKPVTFRDVLEDWSIGGAMTNDFTHLITEAPFAALFWEMPPLTKARLEHEYECVLINGPALGKLETDTRTFSEHFSGAQDIVVFDNLGADAVLVAPVPTPADAQYAHLARFCSTAPPELAGRFWQCIGETALHRIADTPVWISTAGLGVGWLHARLDSRPKYYSHGPYRNWTEQTGDADA